MKARHKLILTLAALVAMAVPAAAQAAAQPSWQLSLTPVPSNLSPGGTSHYMLLATNTGSATTTGPIDLELELPTEVTPQSLTPLSETSFSTQPGAAAPSCTATVFQLSCQSSEPLDPGRHLEVDLKVAVSGAAEGTLSASATIAGGGAPQGASATTSTPVTDESVPFGLLPGFQAPLISEAGEPATAAGSHPSQMTVDFAFPTEQRSSLPANSGHPRDILFDMPAGLLGNPAALPELCTEAYLQAHDGCPDATQVGVISLDTVAIAPAPVQSPVYAMVPPPGSPAELAFDADNIGIFVHLIASVRTDSDYGISVTTPDVPALDIHPVLGARIQIWGDPSANVHDAMRGGCAIFSAPCSVDLKNPQKISFLTLPGSCPGASTRFSVAADSWEQPGQFRSAEYASSDAEGNQVQVAGCNQLSYDPTISVSPTTNLADSPSGLDFQLHQPQEIPHSDPLSGTATAELRDARVVLPPGLVTNPSQADGLAVCSEEEIGYLGEGRYDAVPQSCPPASKLGSAEVTSPLLVQRDSSQNLPIDPESGAPFPEPLHGSVYLAKPLENQFGSLLAIYLAIEDRQSGIVSKLAGEVQSDPATGQLTTVFKENPQLPIEDIHLRLFKGSRAALITPPICGTHATTATLTPWSAPEGADAHPQSSFQTTASPSGGGCPLSEAAQANTPAFSAGTLSPQAGAFSPFVLKVSREDGSQRLVGIDTTLPAGLTGKLAGVAECSDSEIEAAKARSNLEEGRLERDAPSCPAASELGTVDVAAGAGPSPIHTTGHAYLAGPYKGAPLSLAVITPAIAGPFDLGTVVIRAALNIDSETTQIHAVSDPFPAIIHGIPLDLRSVSISLDRPNFTLNPTSCAEMAITGNATSLLGLSVSLSDRFQVGGCQSLPFKPKLALALKGKTKRTSHPKLIANLSSRPGDANIAKAQVKLPKAAFLDQAHVGDVCTRVQFTAKACPPSSVYGTVSATTPLLDYELTGNVYLRSSTHNLPDLVADLNGPASQPIEIALAGKTDAVKGALRNTFEAVPDQPVTRFHLELFGGKKGLIVLSSGLCKSPRATVRLTGQNGKSYNSTPMVGTSCKKKGKGKRSGGSRSRNAHRSAR